MLTSPQGLPLIGFGTYPLQGVEAERTIAMALEVGYRHIDTAQMYGNEREIGRALKASGLPRRELFVVTKVDPGNLGPERFRPSVERSVADLGDVPDLLLIHWPPPDAELDATVDRLREAREAGLARAIGVSNFPATLLARAAARAPIVNNQVEFHPLLDQSAVLAAAQALGITISAYRPLGRGVLLEEPAIVRIATRLGRPPSEIVLRWIIQQGVAAIPMTRRRAHAESNLRALDFVLPDDDMAAISTLTARRQRLIAPASMAGRWDS